MCGCFIGLLVTVSVYYVVKAATIHSNMQIHAWQRAHNSYSVLRIIQIIMFVFVYKHELHQITLGHSFMHTSHAQQ